MRYFRDGNQYVELSDKSPKGFKDVLFIVRLGDASSGEIKETAWSVDQIKHFQRMAGIEPIDRNEWLRTFEPDKLPPEPVVVVQPENVDSTWLVVVPFGIVAFIATVIWMFDQCLR